jgi:hypothetical protein
MLPSRLERRVQRGEFAPLLIGKIQKKRGGGDAVSFSLVMPEEGCVVFIVATS